MFKPSSLAVAIIAVFGASQAHAEGYKLYEQSVSAMGNAYAGRGAEITDASLVYSNPAALSQLSKASLSTGLNLISAKTDYKNAKAQSAGGLSVVGRSEGENSLLEAVPFAFYADKLDDKLSYGVGFYVPFGLSSDYDNDWVGRYFADETAIQVIALQGSMAYQLNHNWSLGVGLSVNHIEGTLSKYKDHNGLCETGNRINALYQADVYNSAYCDSHYEVSGDDIAPGYSLGLHGKLTDNLAIALVYHSELRFRLTGDSVITNTPITGANVAGSPNYIVVAPQLPAIDKKTGKLAASTQLVERSQVPLTTPANLSLSLDHQFAPQWAWQASLSWTGWSAFEHIEITSIDAKPSLSLSTQQPTNLAKPGYIGYIPEYWHDTLSGALGLSYQYQPNLKLKTGLAYDENPISSSHKTARVPTADRTWLTIGANWQLAHNWSLDLAYGYMWMGQLSINEHEFNANDVQLYKSGVQVDYKNHAQVLGAQLNYLF
ncbi:OmpP1/FadL family transporter [Rheinheimera sp.]|uniref:OmpP1/FadL family transporter n=1 Tax=Rheinheimera sp. TaxID=1869214 RepID=UPI0027BA5FD9|nr:OmpP1/FadL family transporter [Rheinheimera sp.]